MYIALAIIARPKVQLRFNQVTKLPTQPAFAYINKQLNKAQINKQPFTSKKKKKKQQP